ncbi:hypothetical protein [Mycobacterium paraffinicum]|uniref:hypothetical protein n=1 Tax=Mycobacterium paraffinicum TaxID=53378 RepID=UPI001ABF3D6F|nr:hypothetical protein [Mycobacterium paraffinicum]
MTGVKGGDENPSARSPTVRRGRLVWLKATAAMLRRLRCWAMLRSKIDLPDRND